MRASTIDDLLTSILRGERVDLDVLNVCDPETLCARAEQHGVMPLLAEHAAGLALAPALRARIQERSTRAVAADLVREAALREALAAMRAAGIEFLVLKGAHLAYSWYQRPDHRPRLDTDILIAPGAREATHVVLHALGYRIPGHVGGDLLLSQTAYVKGHHGETVHTIDVHWRLANPQVFAALPTLDELARDAIDVPGLGPSVRGLAPPAALLFACVHRVAHHYDTPRLIWLYDIHLLASSLQPAEWQRFVTLAAASGVTAICLQSLRTAQHRFRTNIPSEVLADPRLHAPHRTEVTAGYLVPRRRVQQVLGDLRALPRWRDRMQLVRQHLFPSPAYMRETYAESSRTPLPLLYATRVVRGARRWFERFPASDDGLRQR